MTRPCSAGAASRFTRDQLVPAGREKDNRNFRCCVVMAIPQPRSATTGGTRMDSTWIRLARA